MNIDEMFVEGKEEDEDENWDTVVYRFRSPEFDF